MQKFNELFLAFALVFVCCEFGHKLSKSFEEIDKTIGKLRWYKFPLHTWKMLPTLIFGAQEPATLRVFGTVSCTREDFKNVCWFRLDDFIVQLIVQLNIFCDTFWTWFQVFNSGCSYFMVLRKFEYWIQQELTHFSIN